MDSHDPNVNRQNPDLVKFIVLTSAITSTLRYAILGFVLVKFFHFTYESVAVLAGQNTHADLMLRIITNIAVNTGVKDSIFGTIAFLGIGYGYAQKQLRGITIKRIGSRLDQFEKSIDPGKLSSKINLDGSTNKEDLI